MPSEIELSEDQIGRLPVLAAMVEDLKCNNEKINITVPTDMCASYIVEYSSYDDAADYVLSSLPKNAEVARHTLDWCGIDTSTLQTPRELREKLQQQKRLLDKYKWLYGDENKINEKIKNMCNEFI